MSQFKERMQSSGWGFLSVLMPNFRLCMYYYAFKHIRSAVVGICSFDITDNYL